MTAFASKSTFRLLLPALLLAAVLWTVPAMAGDEDPVIVQNAAHEAVTTDGAAVATEDMAEPTAKIEHAEDKLTNAEGAEEPSAHEENVGFPQLNISTYSSQVFWLAISFCLLYILMSRLALPRVTEVMDMRQTQINVNLDRAAQLNDEAKRAHEALDGALAEAQEVARNAVAAAEQKASDAANSDQAAFAERARARVETAEKNIAKAKSDALSSLADIAADAAAEMVAKVGQVQIGKADARQAVQGLMNKA